MTVTIRLGIALTPQERLSLERYLFPKVPTLLTSEDASRWANFLIQHALINVVDQDIIYRNKKNREKKRRSRKKA